MNPASPASTNTAPSRRRRWPWWVAGGVLALLLVLVAGTAIWMASPGSLRQGLRLAQRFLPAEQTLAFTDANGSIAGGGTIASLQWNKPGITVTIENLSLAWSLRPLLGKHLDVRTLHADAVHVRLMPQPEQPDSAPFVMPNQVQLPLRISLPVAVDRVTIDSVDEAGTIQTQVLEQIQANYLFDGTRHDLRLDSLRYGQSHAQALLRLHATNLALQVRVAASLRDLSPKVPFAMQARLAADGTLAGNDAARVQLRLIAREVAHGAPAPDATRLLELLEGLEPQLDETGANASASGALAELQLFTTVHPWRKQPVQQLQLRAQRLDAAAFSVAAPSTRISGDATVEPAGSAAGSTWGAALSLRNTEPGGLDEGRLPVRQLAAEARLADDLVAIENARLLFAGPEPAGVLSAQGELPIGAWMRSRLQLRLERLNLRSLQAGLPTTSLDGDASMTPLGSTAPAGGDAMRIRVNSTNSSAGPLNADRLPVEKLRATLALDPDVWRADDLHLQVGEGSLSLQGTYRPRQRAVDVRARVAQLPLRRIHRDMAADLDATLSGRMSVVGDLTSGLDFDSDIQSDAALTDAAGETRAEWEVRSLQTSGRWEPTRLRISRLHLDAMQARVDGSAIDIALPDFARIEARVRAQAPGVALDADADMQQRSGGGRVDLRLESAQQTVAWLNGLPLMGDRFGDLEASGAALLAADWQGGWQQWQQGLREPTRFPQLRVNASLTSESLALRLPRTDADPLRIDIQRMDARVNGNLASAAAIIDGELRVDDTAATLNLRAGMTRPARPGRVPLWQFDLEQLRATAVLRKAESAWTLALGEALQLSLQTGEVMELQTTAGALTLTAPTEFDARARPLAVTWQPLSLRRGADGAVRLQSKGEVSGIQPGWLDALRDERNGGLLQRAGLYTDLLLGGSWNIDLADRLDLQASLSREEGDVWLLGPQSSDDTGVSRDELLRDGEAAGLRKVDLTVQSRENAVELAVDWDTEHAGAVNARVGTELARRGNGWALPEDAPLRGEIQARLRDLGVWGIFAPPGWRMQGRVDADIQLAGTVQQPLLQGSIQGEELNVRSVLDGVELHQGSLRAALEGQRMRIEQLTFQGGTGSKAYVSGRSGNLTQAPGARGRMTASGSIDWSRAADAADVGTGIEMDIEARLERMQVLVRNDRQLTLSGELSAALAPAGLRVRGDLTVDRATILLPEAGAPTLGEDVIVVRDDDPLEMIEIDPQRRTATGELRTTRTLDLQIELNLGRDLALHGMGITTRLEGELQVRSSVVPGQPFLVFGEVRTIEGRYRAWGQALDVESGVVSFNGSYLNPGLNLLAIRPQIDVRAGVRVTGSLNAPRVDLYSDPALPEAQVLTWVVLGRATASPVPSGDGNSMQRAALGLLAGQAVSSLSGELGVDELGLNEEALSVGKRLSDELYVTYAQGLSGAASTLYLFYDITRKLTLRGEAGEVNAVDLIYTVSFD